MAHDNPPLRTGYTTGSCATAAAAAALELLLNHTYRESIELTLPQGDTAVIPIRHVEITGNAATAQVVKFAGDDPDITGGALISARITLNNTKEVRFFAGSGVGTVTREGLQLPPGEPAINPVPREMMRKAVRAYTDEGVDITIAVEGGRELAEKTFNPRLGIVGGISIIGTSGIVRPFSHAAIEETVRISLDVAAAGGHNRLILVAGHYGLRAAESFYDADAEQIIEVSNSWDIALREAKIKKIDSLLLLSHPGKLVKFIDGHFNTHSQKSPPALQTVLRTADEASIPANPESTTVDGIFQQLSRSDTARLAGILAERIAWAAQSFSGIPGIAVTLINMQNQILAESGDNTQWQKR